MLSDGSDPVSAQATIRTKFIKKSPRWVRSESVAYAAFGGKSSGVVDRDVYELCMSSTNASVSPSVMMQAIRVPVICAPLHRPTLAASVMAELAHLPLASRPPPDEPLHVDVLVGMDFYWSLVRPAVHCTQGGPVAQETALGWMVSGLVREGESQRGPQLGCQLLCLGDLHETRIRQFWELEGIGIHDSGTDCDSASEVQAKFTDTVRMDGDRYEVALPWKRDPHELVDNRRSAEVRLASLSRKLDRDPKLGEEYNLALREMEANGVITEVPQEEAVSDNPTFYLPHRPVVKESSTSTRVRPVFDASATDRNGLSLNDCLEVGPNLIPNLCEVLLRFRRWKFAVTGDIRKAFLQIQVRRADQDVFRFLWEVDGQTRMMRFQRVIFGAVCSPFLLQATIQHHLNKYPPSPAVRELQSSLYVDDFVSGCDTEQGARELLAEAQSILSDAGMELTKFCSNIELELDRAHALAGSAENESVKVLGVKWLPDEDVFVFEGVHLPDRVVPTKRVLLSLIARLFDPMQWLAPHTMVAKCLFQDLWRIGLGWDEILPPEFHDVFSEWVRGLEVLKRLKISRSYLSRGWNGGEDVSLHAFGDASPKGYGAVVYLCCTREDGSREVSLVMARARVAPITAHTLSRLELLGSLLAARLVVFVRQALHLPDTTPSLCWTDSTIVLGWVKGDPARWKQFVSNRVREIQSLTSPSDWGHCSGEHNPADLLTRGVSAESLLESDVWFQGPEWLRSGASDGPVVDLDVEEVVGEQGTGEGLTAAMASVRVTEAEPLFPVERWSSLRKAVRVVGWMHRFVHNVRNPSERRCGDLTTDELDVAQLALFRDVQRGVYSEEINMLSAGKALPRGSHLSKLTPFIDSEGLMRMKGRLQLSDLSYAEKHPVILPKCHLAELLVREQHVLMRHAGVSTLISAVRDQFWIVGLRCMAKRVKRQCVACQRHDARACNEAAAPFPSARVTETPCFSTVGVDMAGPLFCVDFPKKKFYVALFTCAQVRAIHLELTESLSQADILLAFRRFAARRGFPSHVISDQARYFKAADVSLRRYFGDKAPKWSFTVPVAPWHGGFYERLIKSVKMGLRKSLGNRCLTRTELETMLFEIENCVNSRPLTVVTDGPECPNALTPNHFLIGRGAGFQSRVVQDSRPVDAKARSWRGHACGSVG